MQQAGAGIAAVVRRLRPHSRHCTVFAGKGHNGGDVLVAGAALARAGWSVRVVLAADESDLAPLTTEQLPALRALDRVEFSGSAGSPQVVLDGLLGVGCAGSLRGRVRDAADAIAGCRAGGALVVAADLPSGLDADSGQPGEGCVVADVTVTIGYPKAGLSKDPAAACTGAIELVVLNGVEPPESSGPESILTRAELANLLPRRPLTAHKGMCGRLGIVAGSSGFAGAATLAACGALRGGAGLVTLFVNPAIYEIVASTAPPEAMVRASTELAADVLDAGLDALAIGPGAGFEREADMVRLLAGFPGPAVVDADALAWVGRDPSLLTRSGAARLLTPHPGEMQRLFPRREEWTRADWVEAWTAEHPGTLLLKGARTLIGHAGRPLQFNPTGNPGLASGGMGDVLTGLLGALLAQKLGAYEAACLGAWLHGRAADLLVHGGLISEESLLAREVAAHLGPALLDLRSPFVRVGH